MQDDPKFLCFIHMEKCAGSTLHRILTDNFPHYLALSSNKKVRAKFSEHYLDKLKDIYPFNLQGIGGHTVHPYFDYSRVIDKERLFFLTFLRDPVKRYISHLNHQINSKGRDWTIEEFIKETRFNNFQVKKIAGEDDLDLAKKILVGKVNFVGLVEKFDEGLLLLKNMVGGFSNLNYEKANVHSKKKITKSYSFDELSQSTRDKIIDCNQLDIELYTYVKDELYKSLKDSYGYNLEDELKNFKSENKEFNYSKAFEFKFKLKHFIIRNGFQRLAMR